MKKICLWKIVFFKILVKIQLIVKTLSKYIVHFTKSYFISICKASRHYASWQTDNITKDYELINTAGEFAFSQTPLTKYRVYYQEAG